VSKDAHVLYDTGTFGRYVLCLLVVVYRYAEYPYDTVYPDVTPARVRRIGHMWYYRND
jgi:hypothetical protein